MTYDLKTNLFAKIDLAMDEAGLGSMDAGSKISLPRIFVGLSGGADSCALLHSVNEHLGSRYVIRALHADHQLLSISQDWAAHCDRLCQSLQVPLTVESLLIADQGNLEASARHARYEFFARHLSAGDILMLGHHADDQAETLLMRLFQGRGALPMRSWGSLGAGFFLRPFLSLEKSHLTRYLNANDTAWVEDPSNEETGFDRNFLRRNVLPGVQQRWPGFRKGLKRSVDDLFAQQELLEHYIQSVGDEVTLQIIPQAPRLALPWLRIYLSQRGEFRVSDSSLREFLRQMTTADRAMLDLGEASLRVWRDRMYYEPATSIDKPSWSNDPVVLPAQIEWQNSRLKLLASSAGKSEAMGYIGELKVVSRDWLATASGSDFPVLIQSDDLKKRFQAGGIPPWRRGEHPLVLDDHGLVCVPGVWQRSRSGFERHEFSRFCEISLETIGSY